MKLLVVIAALVAVAAGAALPSSVSIWSLEDLSAAIEDPSTSPAILPFLEAALNELMEGMFSGQAQHEIDVHMPIMDVSTWTLNDLSDALEDPSTDAALIPYLEHALNTYLAAVFAGQQIDSITVITPAGLIPSPVDVGPVILPEPVEPVIIPDPVVPTPVTPEVFSSPLVQIIVNVNQVVDVVPEPVQVVEPAPINPIDVIAVGPSEINLIGLIAVSAPEINPVNVINPIVPFFIGVRVVGLIVHGSKAITVNR